MNSCNLTPQEKDLAIQAIVSCGIVKPASVPRVVAGIIQKLGWRNLFWDTAQNLFAIVLFLMGLVLLIAVIPVERHFTATFTLAPLLYLTILLSTETVERIGYLYELKHTCKYSIHHITVVRILCFSLIGLMFCMGMTMYFAKEVSQLLRLLPLALSALFFCALLSLYLKRRTRSVFAHAWAGAAWALLAFVPLIILGEKWEVVLSQLPILLTSSLALLAAILFVREIRKLLSNKEDLRHAYGQSRY